MSAHDKFGFMMNAGSMLLILLAFAQPEIDTTSETVWDAMFVLAFAVAVLGLVGRVITPGPFWYD